MSKRRDRVIAALTLVVLMVIFGFINPAVWRARRVVSETTAVNVLEAIAAAQASFKHDVAVDQDGDGIGEYGTIAELCGLASLRGGEGRKVKYFYLDPDIGEAAGEDGVICYRGYRFRLYLPAGGGQAVADSELVPRADADGADLQEQRFECYAWPERLGLDGTFAAVVGESGVVLMTSNDGFQGYAGAGRVPAAGAARVVGAGDDSRRLDGELVEAQLASDGYMWMVVGN